ncbi:MAG: carboxypeptidase regulatory-like domain-containing protein [Acidobacteriota bacterium]|nr:carboxypeptidase regulatory-like domain-containing protein [Pyrinomonadaceae bacterium]MDW8303912.1 carboxypeptidase regulatory-like domain-containing protein [Acidobacteriota bacterium]
MRKEKISLVLTLVLCLMLSVADAFAQAGTGGITGIITDSTGAVIPNATVKAKNVATGIEITTTTSSEGIYNFTLLRPGEYEVTASAPNFKENKLKVEVQVGRITDANLVLGVAEVGAEVIITAESIQTTQSTSDAVLSETAIENLPINGRRFQDFAILTPTAQIDTERNQISLSGQRGINANINVDGVDYNQPFFGGIRGGERSNFAPTIPQESIKEFQVVAAGYSAEFGRSSGGIINVVTKSGTNQFRGTAFYLIRPEQLSVNHKFVKAIERENNLKIVAAPTQQQFGGSIGGPFVKNKLFYFASFEAQRFRADRNVIFSLGNITRTPANQEAYDYFKSLETGYQLTNDAITGLGRIDWNINSANTINFRFSANRGEGKNSVSVGDAGVLFNPVIDAAISNEGTERDRNYVFVSQWTSAISSRLFNEFRFQYARGERPREANALTPLVTVSQVGIYGTRSFLPTDQYDNRIQFVEALSITSGNHNFKVGVEFSDLYTWQKFGFNQFGSYSFNVVGNTALQVLSLDPTNPNDRRFDGNTFYNQQIGNLIAQFRVQELAFYGQDSWRVTPKFTLNYGLRVEKQFNPSPELGNSDLINIIKSASFPLLGGRNFDPTVIPDSKWQLGPRLGFAWDVEGNGKSVLRGFTGIYYARTPLLLFAGPMNNFRLPPGDVSVQLPFTLPSTFNLNTFLANNPQYVAIMTATGANCTANPASCTPNTVFRQFAILGINLNTRSLGNLPTLTAQQLQQIASALGVQTPPPGFGANLLAMQNDFDNPESYQFGLGYEREILPRFFVGIDYSHVRTVYLQRNRDINLPVPSPANCTSNLAQRPCFNRSLRPVTQIGRLVIRESSASSLFRALTFRMRLVRKWANINAYYTLSRSLSDDDNERNATGIFYENSFDLTPEWGLARLDRTHQFVASPIFFLPYGFEVSSAIRLRSGLPMDAIIGSDVNGDTINNDRPYLVPGVPIKRNAFRNRNEYLVDLRVQKGFRFGERRRIVFSTEFFNLFNNANIQFGGTQTNYCSVRNVNCGLDGVTNPTFRQIRDASGNIITPRGGNFSRTPVFQMQLGIRLQF